MVACFWRGRLGTTLAGAAAAGVLLSGCTSGSSKAAPARTAVSTARSSPVTTEEAVAQAYTAYWPISVQAATLPESQARVLLAPYMTPDAMAHELAGAAAWRRKHFEPWGHVTVHILTVKVNGRIASLTECQDASTAGISDARAHHLIPGTTGSTHVRIRADLRQGDDSRWRLKQKEILETPCTRPSP
jgi:hypothetical protein